MDVSSFRLFRPFVLLTAIVALTSMAAADHVNWQTNLETSLSTANSSGRLVLMKFTADWCGYCKKMERETFTRPTVAQLVNSQFVPVLVDADQHKDLVKHLKIAGLPAILIVSPEMVILHRISGYQSEAKLLPELQKVLAEHGRKAPRQQQFAAASTMPQQPPTPPSPPAVNPFAELDSRPPQTKNVTAASNPFYTDPPIQTAQASQPPNIAPPKTAQAPAAAEITPSFGGLCLPAVTESRSLVSGTPKIAARYHGKILYFSSEDHLRRFQQNPSKYWPMLDGASPVALVEGNQTVEGSLEFAAMFRGKLWVNSSMEELQKFVADPSYYVDALENR